MNLISIIVPVYNTEKYLNQCIESILNQTYKNLEIILIDDGSSDACGLICDEYAIKDARVKVEHKVNEGPMSALKKGIEIASGEYIGFVDSDDFIEHDMYEKMAKCIIQYSADLVQCNMWRYDCVDKFKMLEINCKITFNDKDIKSYLIPQLLNFWEYDKLCVSPSRANKMFREKLVKNSIEECESNIAYGEDLNLTLSAFLKANKIVLLENCLYHYRVNNQSITATYKKRMSENNEYLEKALECVVRNECPTVLSNVKRYIDYLIFQEVKNELRSSYDFKLKYNRTKNILNKHQISAEFYLTYLNNNKKLSDKIIILLLENKSYFLLIAFSYVQCLKRRLMMRGKGNE